MTSAGFDSQVGYAIESPSGTYTAPTRAIEHVKSTLKSTRPDIPSKGIKAGRRHNGRRMKGNEVVAGTISHELSGVNTGVLLVQALGAVSTSGAGPYTHTITPGPLVETRTLTVQVGTPDYAGTINPFNFLGCQVKSGQITVKNGEAAMLDFDWIGQHLQNTGDGDTPGTLVGATYDANWAPFTSLNAVLSINGSEYEFDDITFKFDNGLRTGNYTQRSTTPSRAKLSKEQGFRSWSATINSDLWNLTAMNRAFTGTEVAFSLVLDAGATNKLTIAGNMRSQVDSPTVDGTNLVKQGLNVDLISTSADASACTFTLVNSNSAP